MIRRTTITFLVTFTLITPLLKAQTLQGTAWEGVRSGGGVAKIWFNANDTLYLTEPGGTSQPIGTYQVNIDSLFIQDAPGSPLCSDTTGEYLFTIQDDTLNLILLDDQCDARADDLATLIWYRRAIFSTSESEVGIGIYPNPFTNYLKVRNQSQPEKTAYRIYTAKGRLLRSGILSSGRSEIRTVDLADGVYILSLPEVGMSRMIMKH